MNQQEAIDIAISLKNECKKHLICSECPVHVKEIDDCLLCQGGIDLERIEYFGGFRNSDNVNSPAHYERGGRGGMECIDAIRALCEGLDGVEAYYVGNILKYIWRYKFKNGVEDLYKARKSLDWLIEHEEKESETKM